MPAHRATGTPPPKFVHAFWAPRHRVTAAFLLGAAISLVGLASLAANRASARGPFIGFGSGESGYVATYSVVYPQPEAPRKRRRERISLIGSGAAPKSRSAMGGAQPVCVRLCDGYFFPLPTSASNVGSQTEACDSLCPDAPTEVYYRYGSDRIEDAISAKGQLYSALPVSLRYRATADNTCSCHRDAVAYAPLRDTTLKRGDAVMTPAGFMVFRGVEGVKHGPNDFSALANAGLPASQRGALQVIERASIAKNAPTLKDWLTAQAAPSHRAPYRVAAADRVGARASTSDDKIRLLVWRGAQD